MSLPVYFLEKFLDKVWSKTQGVCFTVCFRKYSYRKNNLILRLPSLNLQIILWLICLLFLQNYKFYESPSTQSHVGIIFCVFLFVLFCEVWLVDQRHWSH